MTASGPAATGVIDELARLVAMPTVSNRPLLELAGHLAQRAEDAGFAVERFAAEGGKCTVVARIGPRRGDGSGLVVSGHMDVVPTEGQPWTSDPFRLVERGGRLYGRGSADMKGFLAVVSLAIQHIARTEWTRECVLVWTHDEEIGCKGSAALAETWRAHPERPALPTACWIGEPTDLAILRMHPGHVAAELEFPGKAAHSSRPDLGHNAIVDAARAVAAIDDLARALESERADLPEMARPWVPINVARIEGGVAVNVVPDRCRLELGWRPLPGQDPHAVWHRIRGCCGPTATGRVLRVTPAMLTPAGTPLEGLLRPHARHPGTGAATFATDGGNLAALGLQPLVFGPGAIEVAHQADEYVPAADLLAAVDLAEDVLRRACCA